MIFASWLSSTVTDKLHFVPNLLKSAGDKPKKFFRSLRSQIILPHFKFRGSAHGYIKRSGYPGHNDACRIYIDVCVFLPTQTVGSSQCRAYNTIGITRAQVLHIIHSRLRVSPYAYSRVNVLYEGYPDRVQIVGLYIAVYNPKFSQSNILCLFLIEYSE